MASECERSRRMGQEREREQVFVKASGLESGGAPIRPDECWPEIPADSIPARPQALQPFLRPLWASSVHSKRCIWFPRQTKKQTRTSWRCLARARVLNRPVPPQTRQPSIHKIPSPYRFPVAIDPTPLNHAIYSTCRHYRELACLQSQSRSHRQLFSGWFPERQ